MPASNGYFIKDLDKVLNINEILNKIFEIEGLDSNGSPKNFQVPAGVLFQAIYANLAGPNDRKDARKIVRVYNNQDPNFYAGNSTLDTLNPEFLSLGSECLVEFGPDGYNQTYILHYSATGPLEVWIDGRMAFPAPKIGAKWSLKGSKEAVSAAFEEFNAATVRYAQGIVVRFKIGDDLRLFAAKQTLNKNEFPGNIIPSPTGEVTDIYWEEISPQGLTIKQADLDALKAEIQVLIDTHSHPLANGTTPGFSQNNYTTAEKNKLASLTNSGTGTGGDTITDLSLAGTTLTLSTDAATFSANLSALQTTIADGSITTSKLADTSVTFSKLGNSSVTNSKISAGAISEDKLDAALQAKVNYTLPVATQTLLGGIKEGAGLKIGADGTASVTVEGISRWEPKAYDQYAVVKHLDSIYIKKTIEQQPFLENPPDTRPEFWVNFSRQIVQDWQNSALYVRGQMVNRANKLYIALEDTFDNDPLTEPGIWNHLLGQNDDRTEYVLPLVQVTGESTTDVISQKGITDALATKADAGPINVLQLRDQDEGINDVTTDGNNLIFNDLAIPLWNGVSLFAGGQNIKDALLTLGSVRIFHDSNENDFFIQDAQGRGVKFDGNIRYPNFTNTLRQIGLGDGVVEGIIQITEDGHLSLEEGGKGFTFRAPNFTTLGTLTLSDEGNLLLNGVALNTNASDFNAAADARIALQKGANNGLATLDAGGKVPTAQLPTLPTNLQSVYVLPAGGTTFTAFSSLITARTSIGNGAKVLLFGGDEQLFGLNDFGNASIVGNGSRVVLDTQAQLITFGKWSDVNLVSSSAGLPYQLKFSSVWENCIVEGKIELLSGATVQLLQNSYFNLTTITGTGTIKIPADCNLTFTSKADTVTLEFQPQSFTIADGSITKPKLSAALQTQLDSAYVSSGLFDSTLVLNRANGTSDSIDLSGLGGGTPGGPLTQRPPEFYSYLFEGQNVTYNLPAGAFYLGNIVSEADSRVLIPDTDYVTNFNLSPPTLTLYGGSGVLTGNVHVQVHFQISGTSGGGGVTYTLPPATATVLGGVKVGDTLTIQTDGTLNYVLPVPSSSVRGGIRIAGGGLRLNQTDFLALSPPTPDGENQSQTSGVIGGVKTFLGAGISIDEAGNISLLPPRTQNDFSSIGAVKAGSGVSIAADGTISVTGGTGTGGGQIDYSQEVSLNANSAILSNGFDRAYALAGGSPGTTITHTLPLGQAKIGGRINVRVRSGALGTYALLCQTNQTIDGQAQILMQAGDSISLVSIGEPGYILQAANDKFIATRIQNGGTDKISISFAFQPGFANEFAVTLEADQASTITSEILSNVLTVTYKKNNSVVAIPFGLNAGDALQVSITRENEALGSAIKLSN